MEQPKVSRAKRPHMNGKKIAFLPLSIILTPPQIRQTFDPEEICRLAHSIIGSGGCVQPPTVARFSEDQFQEYLRMANRFFHGSAALEDFQPADPDAREYYPVVAGAMRTRAYRYLWSTGCDVCHEEFGEECPGQCFQRHFGGDKVKVLLRSDNNPHTALNDMFRENQYNPPKPYEVAEGISAYYEFVKEEQDRAITFRAFSAGFVGWSADKVSESVRYNRLPDFVKQGVQNGVIPLGVSIQLARLQEAGEGENLLHWFVGVVTGRKNVDTLRAEITKFLKERQMYAHGDLTSLMEASQETVTRRMGYKKTIARESLPGIYENLAYFRRVLRLYEEGSLGMDDSVFSEQSIRKVFRELWQVTLQIIDHLEDLTELEKSQAKRDFQVAIDQCNELDRLQGGQDS